MKKLFSWIIIGIGITAMVGAGLEGYVVKKNTAEVNTEMGLYIFTESKPIMEYDYLGTVKTSISWTGYYPELKSILIKKVKKDYPQANAIIINFKNGGDAYADVIKFK